MGIDADNSQRRPPIELIGPGKPCRVLGRTKPALSEGEFRVVKALADAYPDALTREALQFAAGKQAHRILLALRKKDTSWASAILVPTRSVRGGYRLL